MQETPGISVAVVTGGHSFDVVNFHALFRSLKGVNAYIQHLDDFAASPEKARDSYDVVLFYFMPTENPADENIPWYAGKPKTALEHLGETEQGILLLHHAILAYPQWPIWSEIVGIQERSFGYHNDQTIHVDVADAEHPITQDLTGWELVDETYTMDNAGAGSDILLTVDHPKSMRTVAWTRGHKNARVFCYALGHDNQAWSNSSFRQVLTQGIRWAAREI
jgi:hypothetical protein